MHSLVRQILLRLRSFDAVEEEKKLARSEEDSDGELKMNVDTRQNNSSPSSESSSQPSSEVDEPENQHFSQERESERTALTVVASSPSNKPNCEIEYVLLEVFYYLINF